MRRILPQQPVEVCSPIWVCHLLAIVWLFCGLVMWAVGDMGKSVLCLLASGSVVLTPIAYAAGLIDDRGARVRRMIAYRRWVKGGRIGKPHQGGTSSLVRLLQGVLGRKPRA